MNNFIDIDLRKVIGKGYKSFWESKDTYCVLKGGRGSKKSTTAALKLIYNMMKYYHEYDVKPCLLVIRRYQVDHKDSTFAQLRRAIRMLGVSHLWKINYSPIKLTYLPSGQVIIFRGLDDPQSITSITVEDGYLCWAWFEEFFQIEREEDFNKVDMSIRGDLPYPLFKQIIGTLNPWSASSWIKPRFFDDPDELTFTMTRNYDCNEFLSDNDRKIFEIMRTRNPKRFNIEGLGNWGIAEGLIYENWREEYFDYKAMMKQGDIYGNLLYDQKFGLDFGYSNNPTAFIGMLHNPKELTIYIFEEIYLKKMRNKEIYTRIKEKGYADRKIMADSEDRKSIDELYLLGLSRIEGVSKPPGSVVAGIQKLQDYTIIVHPRCKNVVEELMNYCWQLDPNTGNPVNKPLKKYDHAMDAIRYACYDLGGLQLNFI